MSCPMLKRRTHIVLAFVLSAIAAWAQLERAQELARQGKPEAALDALRPLLAQKQEEALLLAGDLWMELERPDSALALYLQIPRAERRPEIVRRIGTAYSLLGKHAEAIRLLRSHYERKPNDLELLLALVQALIAADSLQQAEYLLLRSRDIVPPNAQIYTLLGDLYYRQRVYELARSNYEQAIALDSMAHSARMRLAEVYYRLATRETDRELAAEYFRRSLREWNTLTRLDPTNARAFYEQGRLLFFARQWELAAQALQRFVELRPSGTLGRWYLAQALVELRRCDEALVHLERVAAELDTARPRAQVLLARCLFETQRYDSANALYSALVANSDPPMDAADWERAGISALFRGDTAAAIARFTESLRRDPRRCGLYFQLGMLHYNRRSYSQAIETFRSRLQHCSDTLDARIYALIGAAFLSDNRPDSALPALYASLRLDSTNSFTVRLLLSALAALNRTGEAESVGLRELRRFQALGDRTAVEEICVALLAPLVERKDFQQLLRLSREATRIAPGSAKAWLFLGVAYHGLNDRANACRAYREALRRNPGESTAQQNLKLLECP
jgi:tetratricopeptide (TPR) repeat protein